MEHPLHLEERQLEQQAHSVDSDPIPPTPERQMRLDNPLKRILAVHSVQEPLEQITRLPVHSEPTLQPIHSAKRLLNHPPLVQVQHLAREPQPAASDPLPRQVVSVKPTQQVPLVKNPAPSPSAAASVATTPTPHSVVPIPVRQVHSVPPHPPQAAHSERKLPHPKPTPSVVRSPGPA